VTGGQSDPQGEGVNRRRGIPTHPALPIARTARRRLDEAALAGHGGQQFLAAHLGDLTFAFGESWNHGGLLSRERCSFPKSCGEPWVTV
jgi:hypothetical protein